MATSQIEASDNTKYKMQRINVLLVAAYVTIILCLVVTVFLSDISEYAQAVVTLILGRFLGYTDQVYAFEFGTTRANKVKDDTISTLTNTNASPTTTTTTVATTKE